MAAGESSSSMRRRAWVVEVEKTLDEADASVEVSWWQLHSIYHVPACIKDLNRKAYKPQPTGGVAGPLHRRHSELLPMEEHKEHALRYLLRRSKRPLEEFATAVADIAEQLESVYLDLGAEWRGADGRERFLDGCFLLEVIKATEMLLYATGVVLGKVIKNVVAARKQGTVLRNIRRCIGVLVMKMIASR
ncbi:DUF247 domain protein [Zea mays]|uniref:DUF247 domain protein n=1 Tax=Zea mays TaxID=4577 RepID=A0A1D6L4W4_MAIZE|nr:DUF247 domain protein [Zea mays]